MRENPEHTEQAPLGQILKTFLNWVGFGCSTSIRDLIANATDILNCGVEDFYANIEENWRSSNKGSIDFLEMLEGDII